MKINKETRRLARKLFRCCIVNGRLEEARVRTIVSAVASQKPRHYLGILAEFQKWLRIEIQKSQLLVESSVGLNDNQVHEIQSKVQPHFPRPLISTHKVNSSLIGGLRIKVGSDVWDGSVAARLQQLSIAN